MKKKFTYLPVLAFTLAFGLAVASCGGGSGDSTSSDTSTSTSTGGSSSSSDEGEVIVVTLNEETLSLDRWQDGVLEATVTSDGEEIDAAVTWSSSDPAVATVADGTVVPAGEGTAVITATYEGVSDTCTVTVADSGQLPQLQLSESELELIVGGNAITVDAQVIYLRETMEDAVVTYEIADTAVATVGDDGTVTPVAYGETTLTVQAQWKDVAAEYLTETIDVVVKDDVSVTIGGDAEVQIYERAVTVDEQSFSNTITLESTVVSAGEELPDAAVTWTSSNPSVATVENGKVTGVSEGETEITVSYDSGNEVYQSLPVTVTVLFPVLDKTEEIAAFDVDSGAASAALDAAAVFGAESGKTVEEVYDTEEPETNIYGENGFVMSGLIVGEREMVVRNDEYGYIVPVNVATKIIRTEEDLRNMQTLGGMEPTPMNVDNVDLTYYPYGGYFILANNIVASGSAAISALSSGHNGYRSVARPEMGFTGTFDGRGYVLSGFTFEQGGLFGDISDGAVIKNLGISDARLNGTQAAALGYSIRNARVSDVYIEATNVGSSDPYGNAAIARQSGTSVLLERVVVISSIVTGNGESAAFISNPMDPVTATACYAVYMTADTVQAPSVLKPENMTAVTGLTYEQTEGYTFTGIDSEGSFDAAGRIPVFRNVSLVSASEIAIDGGESFELADYLLTDYYTAEVGTLPEGISYDAGTGTFSAIANVAECSFTFTVVSSLNANIKAEIAVAVHALSVTDVPVEFAAEVDMGGGEDLTLTLPEGVVYNAQSAVEIGETDVSRFAAYDAEANTVTVDNEALTQSGYVDVYVYVGDFRYSYDGILFITKVINTEEDLKAMQTLGGAEATVVRIDNSDVTFYPWSGYFVLGADIAASSSDAYGAKNCNHNGYRAINAAGLGFSGTFDGRGHTISGFTLSAGGLFGDIFGGTVKNVNFADITLTGGSASVFGYAVRGANISDVYIEVTNVGSSDPWANGAIARHAGAGVTLKNVIVVSAIMPGNGECGIFAGRAWDPFTVDNVYAVIVDGTTATAGNSPQNITGVTVMNEADATADKFTGFDDSLWDLSGNIPKLKVIGA